LYSLIEHYEYLIVSFGVMLGTAGIRFPSAAILLTSGKFICKIVHRMTSQKRLNGF